MWSRDVFRPVLARRDPSGISAQPGNIFHINKHFIPEWKLSALLNFFLKDLLFRLKFLRSSQPELPEKRFSQILTIYQNTCTWIYSSKRKKLLKWYLPKSFFLRTLLEWQQCIQIIPNNLRQADWKKSSAWLLLW